MIDGRRHWWAASLVVPLPPWEGDADSLHPLITWWAPLAPGPHPEASGALVQKTMASKICRALGAACQESSVKTGSVLGDDPRITADGFRMPASQEEPRTLISPLAQSRLREPVGGGKEEGAVQEWTAAQASLMTPTSHPGSASSLASCCAGRRSG